MVMLLWVMMHEKTHCLSENPVFLLVKRMTAYLLKIIDNKIAQCFRKIRMYSFFNKLVLPQNIDECGELPTHPEECGELPTQAENCAMIVRNALTELN